MRVSLKNLITSSITIKYHLPYDTEDKQHISRSCISTKEDQCLHQSGTNFDLRTYPGVSFQRMDAPTPQSKGKKKLAPKTPKSNEGGSGDSSSGDGHLGI